MELKVIGSSSAGNAYLLESETEALLIECGVSFSRVKKAVDFNISKIAGCIISHNHGDHCKYALDAAKAGIPIYTSQGTIDAMATNHHRFTPVRAHEVFQVGGFSIWPFDIEHDVPEPLCFIIKHPNCGKVLFLTDTIYCRYQFEGIDNILVEANYALDILDEKVAGGKVQKFLRDRIIKSHMSIDTCIGFLKANDFSRVNNIVLIHLSDSNSDADRFKREVAAATGKRVHVADAGMTIPFDLTAF